MFGQVRCHMECPKRQAPFACHEETRERDLQPGKEAKEACNFRNAMWNIGRLSPWSWCGNPLWNAQHRAANPVTQLGSHLDLLVLVQRSSWHLRLGLAKLPSRFWWPCLGTGWDRPVPVRNQKAAAQPTWTHMNPRVLGNLWSFDVQHLFPPLAGRRSSVWTGLIWSCWAMTWAGASTIHRRVQSIWLKYFLYRYNNDELMN